MEIKFSRHFPRVAKHFLTLLRVTASPLFVTLFGLSLQHLSSFSKLSSPGRLLAEVSLSIRLNFLVENLNTTCKWLSRGPYGVGIKNLQAWFL